MNITELVRKSVFHVSRVAKQHAPEILAVIGVGGFITTAVLAVKATPEAEELIEEKKEELGKDELTVVETVKAAYKPYLPAIFTGTTSALCIIGSVNTSLKRNAALATAYRMSQTMMDEYREKTIDLFGEKKDSKIRSAIAKDHIDKDEPDNDVNVIDSDDDDKGFKILVRDELSGYYLPVKDLDIIRYAIGRGYDKQEKSFDESMSEYEWLNILNPRITDNMTETQIRMAQNSYWSSATPYEGFSCELDESSLTTIKNGKWKGYPCYAITYGSLPKYQEYWRSY